ncbi:MAG: hypothetical protein V1905_02100 [bacterium]
MLLTIFTNPRPFTGPFNLIQRNAIKSWQALGVDCEIILINDEEGTTINVAKELKVRCIEKIKTNEFKTPLLNDVFGRVREMASGQIIAQVNADIILTDSFVKTISLTVKQLNNQPFFMIGRRWDLDFNEEINFNDPNWRKELLLKVNEFGRLHGISGIDYWVFPKSFDFNPPAFNVGRVGMDSWLIYRARTLKIPVIDATEMVTIIHQNHNYPQKKKDYFKLETEQNLKLSGAPLNSMSLLDADWLINDRGNLIRPPFPRRIFSILSLFYPWRLLLAIKRKIIHR